MGIDHYIGFIKLSHFSVKEYLISESIQNHAIKQVRDFSFNEELSHSVICQICLAYLLQFCTSEYLDIAVNVSSPLAEYAAENWITHAHSWSKNKSQSSSVFGGLSSAPPIPAGIRSFQWNSGGFQWNEI